MQKNSKTNRKYLLTLRPFGQHLPEIANGWHIWRRKLPQRNCLCYPPGGKAPKYGFHHKHDTILYYSKENEPKFNHQFTPLTKEQIVKFTKTDKDGRKYREYRGQTCIYLDDIPGSPVPSWWVDIHSLGQTISKERTGWATQKPIALYSRIILAITNPGDVVFDPFCGCACAITLVSAENASRQWIGIDRHPEAENKSSKNSTMEQKPKRKTNCEKIREEE